MTGTGWGPQHRSRTQSIPYTSLLPRHTISLVRGCCSHQCYTKPAQSVSFWVCPPVHQLLASFMGTSGHLAFAASSCHLPPSLAHLPEWCGQLLANACSSPFSSGHSQSASRPAGRDGGSTCHGTAPPAASASPATTAGHCGLPKMHF